MEIVFVIAPKTASFKSTSSMEKGSSASQDTPTHAVNSATSQGQGRSNHPLRRYAEVAKVLVKFKAQQESKAEREKHEHQRLKACIADIKEQQGVRSAKDGPCFIKPDHLGLGLNLVALESRHREQRSFVAKEDNQGTDISSITSPQHKTTLDGSVHSSSSALLPRHKLRFNVPNHILYRRQGNHEVIPWLNERVRISAKPIEFTIPGDIHQLENLQVESYLAKYCKIPHDRMVVFGRYFKKFRDKDTNKIPQNSIVAAIVALLYNAASLEEVKSFLQRLGLSCVAKGKATHTSYDLPTFARIAAVTERILYLSYVEAGGPAGLGVMRTFLESADFCALNWRMDGLKVEPALKRLLISL